jgi:hypothetical protein
VRATAAVLLSGLALGCQPEPAKVGTDVGRAAADTETLRVASAAVNEVLRLSHDCDAARPLIAEAKAKLQETEPHVRTTTGRATLEALRAQLANIETNCP